MLTWTDPATGDPEHDPGLRFIDGTNRWLVAVVNATDPRAGWCVWERRGSNYVRVCPTVRIGSEVEAKAVANVLDSHVVRHVVRFAEFTSTAAAILVVKAAQRLLLMVPPAAPAYMSPEQPTSTEDA